MGMPLFPEARLFYRSAFQRLDDAEFLLSGGRTTGALYLAGYAVECMLKALILSRISKSEERLAMLDSFRGVKAHDFEWLKAQYFGKKFWKNKGPQFSSDIAQSFSLVNTWSTDLRYRPGTVPARDAESFLRATQSLIQWADGRL